MNARSNAKSAITAITHQNATAERALRYHDIIITALRTVDKGVINVEENESSDRLKIHAVPRVQYMGQGTQGLYMMRQQCEAENAGVIIPTQVRWLANPHAIREWRQNGEIAASSVVYDVNGSKVAKSLVKKAIEAAGVWYRVETYTHMGPESRCELCCGWGHIENKCGSKPTLSYCSGHHRTRNDKCNMAGCTAMLGSLRSHTLEKCPNCKGNHIAFSMSCAKKTEAAKAARQCWAIGLAGRASTNAATDVALGTKRLMIGHWLKETTQEGGGTEA